MAFSFLTMTLVILSLSTLYSIEAKNGGGFSVELVHRDSPNSPYYNQTETHSQRLANAFRRSFTRAHRFIKNKAAVSPNTAQATLSSNFGEYLMDISLGTPPFRIRAIADTGSDLIWTQCQPCSECYKQVDPLFDPRKSTTYKPIPCDSDVCQSLTQPSCSTSSRCPYTVTYGDRSFTNGDLATETVTLGSTSGRPVQLPRSIIGCGFRNNGTFNERGSGIVGLGGGLESLITQMGRSINGKFSYCLVPLASQTKNSSKLNFGSKAVVSGAGVVSTPLVDGNTPTFYLLTLNAISVGSMRVDFGGSMGTSGTEIGNIIIDSGTTLTLFPEDFYSELESAAESQIELKRVSDPSGTLSLCYESRTDNIKVPKMIVHFDGADVELGVKNSFVRMAEDVVCFAFASFGDSAIYGNIAQMDFLVGYDVQAKMVSFKPSDCTRF